MANQIILASNSPRRKELLSNLGFGFEVRVKEVDESFPKELSPTQIAEFIAQTKANAYSVSDHETLITADTVVAHKGQILGKPENKAHAVDMLKQLSGNTHKVITGVCIKTNDKQVLFSETTVVHFKQLSETEILHYVDHYKPYDKAGAYGIQEWIGMIGVERIEGCFYNVMGLPTQKLYEVLVSSFR